MTERDRFSLSARLVSVAQRHATEPAVWCDGEEIAFRDLINWASILAGRLTQFGVEPGDRVVVALPRSAELVAGIAACVLARTPFLAIPPEDPPARVALQLADAAPAAILTDDRTAARFGVPADKRIDLSRPAASDETPAPDRSDARPLAADPRFPPPSDDPDLCVYFAYTSGSTGRPKAAMNRQGGVATLLDHLNGMLPFGPGDRLLQRTSIGFDVAVAEFLWPLTTGACIVLPPPGMERDTEALVGFMADRAITFGYLVPTTLRDLLALPSLPPLPSLRRLAVIGEVLPMALVRDYHARFSTPLDNQYGPAEAAVAVSSWTTDPDYGGALAPIGVPFAGSDLFVVDDDLRPVPPGERGEVLIGGPQVGLGYWQRPDLTAERFLDGPLPDLPGTRFYRTGDIGERRPDGTFVCYGRKDGQVKIDGVRLELGEVESALEDLPEIEAAVAIPWDSGSGAKRVAVYLVQRPGTEPLTPETLRDRLADRLVPAALPARAIVLDRFPRLPNGKVDRNALPDPSVPRVGLSEAFSAPADGIEGAVASLWTRFFDTVEIGAQDSFFELGGTSLQAARMIAAVNRHFGIALPVTAAFTDRTPATLAARIAEATSSGIDRSEPGRGVDPAGQPTADPNRAIAIVAMAGRFPGAQTVEDFASNLLAGRDSMTRFAPETLEAPPETAGAPNYVPVRGIVDGADLFDPAFYGLSPREAAAIDPQHRLLLDCTAEALDAVGYLTEPADCPIGVFVGVGEPFYWHANVLPHAQAAGTVGALADGFANDKDYAATRVAHRLNLTGPALTVQTACSTSLASVAAAVDALRLGRCGMAVAGGLSLRVPQRVGHLYQEGAMFSADGTCRPFDADATGTLFNDGGGVVVLKPLATAERDGDPIVAVITGVGIGNDGADKASFTAPSVAGQVKAATAALAEAGIDGNGIGFVEAHGTGTPLGDPIEVEALSKAYRIADRTGPPLLLGSVKSNVGHLVAGAGIAGLIKAALAVRDGRIPGTVHFKALNPAIDDCGGKLTVPTGTTAWPAAAHPRRAGVTSLGVGGTNVHVILEQAPDDTLPSPSALPVMTLSAPTPAGVATVADGLARRIDADPAGLPDLLIAQHRRRGERYRLSLPASDPETLRRGLGGAAAGTIPPQDTKAAGTRLAYLFTGQGSQYLGMAADLYETVPTIRRAIDDGLAALPFGADAVRSRLLDRPSGLPDFDDTETAQPALAILERAVAMTVRDLGPHPDILLGHSLGELVAAHLAGVFTLDGLMTAVAERARIMAALPPGSLLAVRGTEADATPFLTADVSVAAINGADQVVLAGETGAVDAVGAALEGAGHAVTRLKTGHAFHSPLVDPAIGPLTEAMATVPLSAPERPILSAVTGGPLTAEEATDPAFWGQQIRRTVQFHAALEEMAAAGVGLAVEMGPKGTLCRMAARTLRDRITAVSALGTGAGKEVSGFAEALGRLWAAGRPVDWTAAERYGVRRPPLSLPMGRCPTRCWIDPPTKTVRHGIVATEHPPEPSAPASAEIAMQSATHPTPIAVDRPEEALRSAVVDTIADLAGTVPAAHDLDRPFLELGLDSLMLTQLGLAVRKRWGLALSQRVLATEVDTPTKLIARLAAEGVAPSQASATPPSAAQAPPVAAHRPLAPARPIDPDGSHGPAAAPSPPSHGTAERPAFGAQVKIARQVSQALTERQRAHIAALVDLTVRRTPKAKASAEAHRPYLADPRTVAGFNPLWKEMVYPVVVDRSDGAEFTDIDGNAYVDMFGGFGANILGHRHPAVMAAIRRQLDAGFELGPQNPLTGAFADRIARMTGLDRVALCTTGSEAVAGAVRACRTATGRDRIVTFTKAYHGIFDEVIVRGGPDGRGRPAASGIPDAKVADVVVLDYGDPAALERLREIVDNVAAVLVEPVQSRQLDVQPHGFLQELRGITERAGTALLFDEVITGFRVAPGGAQEYFGVAADVATYGKILGGGLPGAAIAGKPWIMDALDGGMWRYGDDSRPEVGLTYFAGTMVRHPLAMAAGNAVLEVLEAEGPGFQKRLTDRTTEVVAAFKTAVDYFGAPFRIPHFSSAFRVEPIPGIPFADLIFYHLRARGVFIQEDRTWFLTAAHTDAHLDRVVTAFRDSLAAMAEGGLFERPATERATRPPVPGAALGRDPAGKAIWVLPDGAGGWRPVDGRHAPQLHSRVDA